MQLSSEQIRWIDGALIFVFSLALIALEKGRHGAKSSTVLVLSGLFSPPDLFGRLCTQAQWRKVVSGKTYSVFGSGLILTKVAAVETGVASQITAIRSRFIRNLLVDVK